MGPTCEILLESADDATLHAIDAYLVSRAGDVDRTRKGRVWEVRIDGRPVYVNIVCEPPVVELSAGCNDRVDHDLLRELSAGLVGVIGGLATEPSN